MAENAEETWKTNMEALMARVDGIKKEIEEMGSMGDSVGITDAEKQQAYGLGYQFFQQKKYDNAMIIFEALYVLDPLNADYSKAIAVTLQMQGNLGDAAIQYLMTYFFHQEDLSMAMFSARCMIELGGGEQAYYVLRSIVDAKRYPSTPNNDHCLEIISAMLEGLKGSMKKSRAKKSVTKDKAVGDEPSSEQTSTPAPAPTK
ncbi:MAG: tetratricopeptide repeat protein [Puniceicoccales bacterium]|jgi:tetratricopeptide (TPR) repeat protein|nr:tetratricopeptide repeat protein [Puniceicoccales bacterium]